MQTSVNLQEPFSYSIWYIFIILIFLIVLTIYLLKKKKIKQKNHIPEIKEMDIKEIEIIKQKYVRNLNELQSKLENNKISIRKAYQSLSTYIRYFVYEVTNIRVQNYTLSEIKEIDMPILYELIQEYYTPEFSEYSFGNVKESIEKTRKVIEKWS